MFERKITSLAVAISFVVGCALATINLSGSQAQSNADWKPQWTMGGELVLPKDFHSWVFLGSPLTPHALNGGSAPFPEYHNVYVHPEPLRQYRSSGEWPEGTILLKELQLTRSAIHADGSSEEASGRGFFPSALNGIDISVKDSSRFGNSNGWGFFNFGHHAPPYAEMAAVQPVEACASCHIDNADNMVFTKFYRPILESAH